jgi:hypothetical protein
MVDSLNSVRREYGRHFRKKRRNFLKLKLMNMRLTVKIKYIRDFYRGISDVKKGDQPRTNVVKDEKGDLVTAAQYFG